MKTLLSIGDFVDLYYKFSSSGFGRILYRLLPSFKKSRTKKSWNYLQESSPANYWDLPLVHKRWNKLISGNPEIEYPQYIMSKYLSDRNYLKLLSPGCGTGQKELKFASFNNFSLIEAFDLSPQRITFANKTVVQLGIKNIIYSVSDVLSFDFGNDRYDVILFDSFLHHIKNLDDVLAKVHVSLRKNGILIIMEYVGPARFQWTQEQLKKSNEILKKLPSTYRRRFGNSKIKSKIFRPGLLRMIMSDPSEAVSSDLILAKLKTYFKTIEEKQIGGNILQLILKDISHNFIELTDESVGLLFQIFDIEDEFLAAGNKADFIFGVYSK